MYKQQNIASCRRISQMWHLTWEGISEFFLLPVMGLPNYNKGAYNMKKKKDGNNFSLVLSSLIKHVLKTSSVPHSSCSVCPLSLHYNHMNFEIYGQFWKLVTNKSQNIMTVWQTSKIKMKNLWNRIFNWVNKICNRR